MKEQKIILERKERNLKMLWYHDEKVRGEKMHSH